VNKDEVTKLAILKEKRAKLNRSDDEAKPQSFRLEKQYKNLNP
jgi:hypothetical protein